MRLLWITNIGLTILEVAELELIVNAYLNTNDVENEPINYTVTSIRLRERLKREGISLKVNDTFTQADINESDVLYIPNANENGTDSFGFKVSDGTNEVTGQVFYINITAVNDVPIVDTPSAAGYTDTAAADTFNNTTDSLTAADAEGTALTYGIEADKRQYNNKHNNL